MLRTKSLVHKPPIIVRRVVDRGREGMLGSEFVSGNEHACPGRVREMSGGLATRVRRGDHVPATVLVHDRRVAVPGLGRRPQAAHLGGLFVGHALGLGGHVFLVFTRLTLVDVRGIGCTTRALVGLAHSGAVSAPS
jgi:hypothetical protein